MSTNQEGNSYLFTLLSQGNIHLQPFYDCSIPILQFAPFEVRDPFYIIFPQSYHSNQQQPKIYPMMQETFTPIMSQELSTGMTTQHRKSNVKLICPHKDRKHYAKVRVVIRICALIATIDMAETRKLGCVITQISLIMHMESTKTAICVIIT